MAEYCKEWNLDCGYWDSTGCCVYSEKFERAIQRKPACTTDGTSVSGHQTDSRHEFITRGISKIMRQNAEILKLMGKDKMPDFERGRLQGIKEMKELYKKSR